ncbi:Elongator complex protein 5 [Absidia repens]|uniref:Elongator complex protein 5 n=1 Tax=Absidia repens TaxID=90262 RepID=A0A1X2IWF5_9FUNG|nr:Elongator complex protein 5 [Absidia repens]
MQPMTTKNVMMQQLPPLSDSLNRLAAVVITLDQLKAPTAQTEAQARLTGFVAQDTFSYLHITSNHVARGGVAKVEWRRKSGKVIYETNGFFVEPSTRRLVVVHASQLGIQEQEDDHNDGDDDDGKNKDGNTLDPTANLSFNLTLTDEQRKTKENLVLPYYKAQQVEIDGGSSSNHTPAAGGSIYYEPDAADDFDDEDPDEDLDI